MCVCACARKSKHNTRFYSVLTHQNLLRVLQVPPECNTCIHIQKQILSLNATHAYIYTYNSSSYSLSLSLHIYVDVDVDIYTYAYIDTLHVHMQRGDTPGMALQAAAKYEAANCADGDTPDRRSVR